MVAIKVKSWRAAWSQYRGHIAPQCNLRNCIHSRNIWQRMRRKSLGVRMDGTWYCRPECLERALTMLLQQLESAVARTLPAPHRIPLGLLLLSRQDITVKELQAALQAQQRSNRGRIGEWLQELGFVSEQQVTAALARQWSCPVLRVIPATLQSERGPTIPVVLLEYFSMIPIDFVEATATLYIAFGERIEYSVLYAVEHMLGCHTEPCLVAPSTLHNRLLAIVERGHRAEVVFDRVLDGAESARIVRSYVTRLAASEIRIARCGQYTWVRLARPAGDVINLLLRSSPHTDSSPAVLTLPAVTSAF
jgi:hypothetical protein